MQYLGNGIDLTITADQILVESRPTDPNDPYTSIALVDCKGTLYPFQDVPTVYLPPGCDFTIQTL